MTPTVLFAMHYNVSNYFYTLASAYDLENNGKGMIAILKPNQLSWDSNEWQGVHHRRVGFDQSKRFAGLSKPKQILELRKLLKEEKVDAVLTTAFTAPIIKALGVPYIYFVYGWDLDYHAFHGAEAFPKLFPGAWSLMTRFLPGPAVKGAAALDGHIIKKYIRWGMSRADVTVFPPHQRPLMNEVGCRRAAYLPQCLDTIFFDLRPEDKSAAWAQVREKYDCDRVFFSSTRHMWIRNMKDVLFYKGNDVIIRSFAQYLETSGDKRAKLFLVEKGWHVKESKELIRSLGAEDAVIWLDHQPRKELIRFYLASDAVFDQFDGGIFALCALEALACWTPTITYIGENNPYPTPPPIMNSKNEEEIAAFMSKVAFDRGVAEPLKLKSREWVENNCSPSNFARALKDLASSII